MPMKTKLPRILQILYYKCRVCRFRILLEIYNETIEDDLDS